MPKYLLALMILLPGSGLVMPATAPAQNGAEEPRPVEFVDLDRYAGTWYEIMKIPNFFQKVCARETTATYTPRGDGTIDVLNRCVDEDGKIVEAAGLAEVVDSTSNARLKVSFVKVLGKSMFWGDYWVLGLGEDYDWVVVGTGDRKYGWILSRAPELTYEQAEEAFWTLGEQGYDRADFILTDHVTQP